MKHLKIEAKRQSSDFYIEMENEEENSLKSLLWMMNEAFEKDQLKWSEDESRAI